MAAYQTVTPLTLGELWAIPIMLRLALIDVYNCQDEDIGDIKEIMLDISTGKVAYAVLSFGSFLGLGEKLFAVPWNALRLDTENKRFVLDIDKERLQDAPGFDKSNWPDMADSRWTNDIHSYYRTKPFDHNDSVL